jgi:hypothetical protein
MTSNMHSLWQRTPWDKNLASLVSPAAVPQGNVADSKGAASLLESRPSLESAILPHRRIVLS